MGITDIAILKDHSYRLMKMRIKIKKKKIITELAIIHSLLKAI